MQNALKKLFFLLLIVSTTRLVLPMFEHRTEETRTKTREEERLELEEAARRQKIRRENAEASAKITRKRAEEEGYEIQESAKKRRKFSEEERGKFIEERQELTKKRTQLIKTLKKANMDQLQLASLTIKINPEEDECPVCGDFLENPESDDPEAIKDDWVILLCGHAFHRKCINPWIDQQGTCPMCRKVISKENYDAHIEREERAPLLQPIIQTVLDALWQNFQFRWELEKNINTFNAQSLIDLFVKKLGIQDVVQIS